MMQVRPSSTRLTRAVLIPIAILAWLAVVLLAGWLLSHVIRALLVLVLAVVIAFAVTPIVNLLARWVPRPVAIAIAYVLALVIVFGFLSLLIAAAAAQIGDAVKNLPAYSRSLEHVEPQIDRFLSPLGVTTAQLNSYRESAVSYLRGSGTRAARDALDVVALVVNAVIDSVLVVMLSIYLTANGPRIRQLLREQAPRTQRRRTMLLVGIVNHVVGGYVRGQLTLAALVGALVMVGMLALGVPYAVLLGLIAFFMEFIPILGVFISGAICIVAALSHGWIIALVVLLYFVGVHIVEGDWLGPRIVGRAVGIHPAVALLALVAGTDLFGFWGALFGAPLAGLIQATFTAAWLEIRHGETPRVIEDVVNTGDTTATKEPDEGEGKSQEEKAIDAASKDETKGDSPADRVVNRLRGKKGQPKTPAA